MKKGIIFIVLAVIFFMVGYTQKISRMERKITIEAGDEIEIRTGNASIIMKKDGTILISGKDLSIKGTGDVVMKGKKIMEN